MARGPRTPKESSRSGSNLAPPVQKDKDKNRKDSRKRSEVSKDAASKSDEPVLKKAKAVSNNAASHDNAKEAKAVSKDAAHHDDDRIPKKHKTVSNDAAIKTNTSATKIDMDDVVVCKDPRPLKSKAVSDLGSDSEEEGAKQLMELATERFLRIVSYPARSPQRLFTRATQRCVCHVLAGVCTGQRTLVCSLAMRRWFAHCEPSYPLPRVIEDSTEPDRSSDPYQTDVAGTSGDVEVDDDDEDDEEDEDPSIAEMKNSPYYVCKGVKHHCVTVNTQWVHRMIASAD